MKIKSTATNCEHNGGIVGHIRGGSSESENRRVVVTENYFGGRSDDCKICKFSAC